MKKENPLWKAVSARAKTPQKKTVTIPLSDVPRGANVGDEITITGTIDAIQAGAATISVTAVNQPQGETDGREETKTAQVLNVRTQESNVGGM